MAETATIKTAEATRTNLFIEPDLWRALKIRAIEEHMTATHLLNRIIEDYLMQHTVKAKPKTTKKGA